MGKLRTFLPWSRMTHIILTPADIATLVGGKDLTCVGGPSIIIRFSAAPGVRGGPQEETETSDGLPLPPTSITLTCEKCGLQGHGWSGRKMGAHRRYCTGTAAPAPDPLVAARVAVGISERLSNACRYCRRELSSQGRLRQHERTCSENPESPRGRTEAKIGGPPVSECCGASLHEGDSHELGGRAYCDKCGQPCRWVRQLPERYTGFVCKGMRDCPRKTEYKDGYCLPCWQKRRPKVSAEEQEVLAEIHKEDPPEEE